MSKAEKLSFYLYRDKYLEAGSPPLKDFFSKVLTSKERWWCFHVVNEVNRDGTNQIHE